jgi:hypothetical protein
MGEGLLLCRNDEVTPACGKGKNCTSVQASVASEIAEQNNQVEEDEMGWSCSTYGGEEEGV